MAFSWLAALLLQLCFLNFSSALPQGTFAIPTPAPSNSTCNGCEIAISETFLTYPTPVSLTVSSVTKTIIPYITQYPNGTDITHFSTYTRFVQNATAQTAFIEPNTTALTWTTLGTTLTYPTTYVAFVDGAAGTSSTMQIGTATFCQAPTLTQFAAPTADLQKLIFPLIAVNGSDAEFKQKAFKYLEDLPTVTAVLGGDFNPHSCKVSAVLAMGSPRPDNPDNAMGGDKGGIGGGKGSSANGHDNDGDIPIDDGSNTPTQAVTHTSVAVLTSFGNPVVTSIAAPAPPARPASMEAGAGGQSPTTKEDILQPINSFLDSLFKTPTPAPTPASPQNALSSFFSVLGINPQAPATSPAAVVVAPIPVQTAAPAVGAGASNGGSGSNAGGNVAPAVNAGSSNSGSGSSDKMSNQVVAIGNSGNSGNAGSGQALAQVAGSSALATITPAPQILKPAQQPVTIGANVVSVAQASNGNGVVLGGIVTLAAGASTKVNGVEVSVAATGGAIVIGSSTVAITASGYISSTYVPVVTLGSSTFTANAQGNFVIGGQTVTAGGSTIVVGGQTLSAGGAITVAGNVVSLAKTGGVAVVNGHTATLSSALVSVTVKAQPGGTGAAAAMATATSSPFDGGASGGSSGSTNSGKTNPAVVKAINAAPKHSSFVGVIGSLFAIAVAFITLL